MTTNIGILTQTQKKYETQKTELDNQIQYNEKQIDKNNAEITDLQTLDETDRVEIPERSADDIKSEVEADFQFKYDAASQTLEQELSNAEQNYNSKCIQINTDYSSKENAIKTKYQNQINELNSSFNFDDESVSNNDIDNKIRQLEQKKDEELQALKSEQDEKLKQAEQEKQSEIEKANQKYALSNQQIAQEIATETDRRIADEQAKAEANAAELSGDSQKVNDRIQTLTDQNQDLTTQNTTLKEQSTQIDSQIEELIRQQETAVPEETTSATSPKNTIAADEVDDENIVKLKSEDALTKEEKKARNQALSDYEDVLSEELGKEYKITKDKKTGAITAVAKDGSGRAININMGITENGQLNIVRTDNRNADEEVVTHTTHNIDGDKKTSDIANHTTKEVTTTNKKNNTVTTQSYGNDNTIDSEISTVTNDVSTKTTRTTFDSSGNIQNKNITEDNGYTVRNTNEDYVVINGKTLISSQTISQTDPEQEYPPMSITYSYDADGNKTGTQKISENGNRTETFDANDRITARTIINGSERTENNYEYGENGVRRQTTKQFKDNADTPYSESQEIYNANNELVRSASHTITDDAEITVIKDGQTVQRNIKSQVDGSCIQTTFANDGETRLLEIFQSPNGNTRVQRYNEDGSTLATVQPTDGTVNYKSNPVSAREVAERYGLTEQQIIEANGGKKVFEAGEQAVIPNSVSIAKFLDDASPDAILKAKQKSYQNVAHFEEYYGAARDIMTNAGANPKNIRYFNENTEHTVWYDSFVGTSDGTQYNEVDGVLYGGVESTSGRNAVFLAQATVNYDGQQQNLTLAKIKGNGNYVWCKFVENPSKPGYGDYELVGSAIQGITTGQAVHIDGAGSEYNGDGSHSIMNETMVHGSASASAYAKFNEAVSKGDVDQVTMAMVRGAVGYQGAKAVVDDGRQWRNTSIGEALAAPFMSDLTEENIRIFNNANATMNEYTSQLYNLFTKDGIGNYEEAKKKAEPILNNIKKLDASFDPQNAFETIYKNRAKIAEVGSYVDTGISMSLAMIPVGGWALSAGYNATNNTLKGMDPGDVYLNFLSDAAFNKLGQVAGGKISQFTSGITSTFAREATDLGLNIVSDAVQETAQDYVSSVINHTEFNFGESATRNIVMSAGTNTGFKLLGKGIEAATPYVSDALGSLKSNLGFGTTDLDLPMSETAVLGQYTTNTSHTDVDIAQVKPDVTAQNDEWIQTLEAHRSASKGLSETEVAGIRSHIDNIDDIATLTQLQNQLLGDSSHSKIAMTTADRQKFRAQFDEAAERITHQGFLRDLNSNSSTADITAARQLIENSTTLSPTHKSDLLRQADAMLGQRDYDAAISMINGGYSRYEDNTALTDLVNGSRYLTEAQKHELLSLDASSPNAEAVYNSLLNKISEVSQQGNPLMRDLDSGWNGTRTAYGQALDGFDVYNGHQRYGYVFSAEGNSDLSRTYGLFGATPDAQTKFMDFGVSLSSTNLDKLQNIGQLGRNLGSDFQIELQGLGAHMIETGALDQAGIHAANARDYGLTNWDAVTSRGIDAQTIDELADLAGKSYNMSVDSNGNPVRTTSNGWNEIDDVRNSETGFHAKVYEKEGKVTIAFSGSDDVHDIVSDHQIVNGQIPDQIQDMQQLLQRIKKEHPDKQILLTGHSLGGGLAEMAASLPDAGNVTAVTFDSVGMKGLVTSDEGIKLGLTDNGNSVNFVVRDDLISNATEHTGTTIITDRTNLRQDEHAIQQFLGEGNSLVGTQGGMTALNDAKFDELGTGTVKIKNPDGTVTKRTGNFTLSEQIRLQGENVVLSAEEFRYTQNKFQADVNSLNADLDALEEQITHLASPDQRTKLERIIQARRNALQTDFNIESHVDQSRTVTMTGDETNALLMRDYGFDKPAFPEGQTKNVRKLTLKSDATFVRVYCETGNPPSFAKGVWLMAADEIKGLTPAQIKDKFALPGMPSHVVEIKVEAGTEMISGACGKIEGWGNGGGTQYFLTGGKSHNYSNFRRLVNN